MEQPKEYYAFISYKREDIKEAKRLQHALEYYRLPNHLRQENPELPEYVRPVFRDMTDLEVGELSAQIHAGLEQSHFLIVVCSPRAAASKWVNDEVEYFISLGKQDKIIPYIIEGVPHASNPNEECFPSALLELSKKKELLGANINEVGKDAATIRVVSRMFNIRFDTLYQRYQREQKKRRWRLSVVIIFAFLFLAVIAGWIWHQNTKLKIITSRASAEAAVRLINGGDSYTARKVALSALDIAYTPEAEVALRKASYNNSAILNQNGSSVIFATYSKDGDLMCSISSDSTLTIWDTYSGGKKYTIINHFGEYVSADFSPDNQRVITISSDSTLRVYDIATNEQLIYTKDRNKFNNAFYSLNGEYVLISSKYGSSLQKREASNLMLIDTVDLVSDHMISSSMYSSAGDYIVSTTMDFVYEIWSGKSGEKLYEITGTAPAVFNLDGSMIASGSGPMAPQGIKITSTINGKEIISFGDRMSKPHIITFSPNNDIIATANTFGDTITIWDFSETVMTHYQGSVRLGNLKVLKDTVRNAYVIKKLYGHTGDINTLKYNPRGDIILSSSTDGTMRLWDVKTSPYTKQMINKSLINAHSVASNGDVLVSIPLGNISNIALVDLKEGNTKDSVLCDFTSSYAHTFIKLSPSGKKLVLGGWDGALIEYNLNIGLIDTIECKGWFGCAAFSQNEHLIAYSNSNHIVLFDSSINKIIWDTIGHDSFISTVQFSNDGKYILTTSWDKTIKIWETNSGKLMHALVGHKDYIEEATLSPNGRYLATISKDGVGKIWDIYTSKELYSFLKVHNMVFSPDGENIILNQYQNIDNIRLFNIITGETIVTMNQPASYIFFLSNKKQFVIISTNDGMITTYDFPILDDLMDETRKRFKDTPLTPEERRQYYLE